MIDLVIDLARDPIWQFVGIIIALAAIWVTLWVFKRQKLSKILGYKVETNVSLLSIHDEAKRRFEIRFDGRTVGDALLFIVKFFNAGNSPIARHDFDRPLSISFGEGSHILSCDVTLKSPSALDVEFNKADGESAILKPMLLNEHETFTLKMMVIDYVPQDFSISARIIGGRLEDVGNRPTSLLKAFGVFICTFTISYGVILGSQYYRKFLEATGYLIYDNLISAFIFGAIGVRVYMYIAQSKSPPS